MKATPSLFKSLENLLPKDEDGEPLSNDAIVKHIEARDAKRAEDLKALKNHRPRIPCPNQAPLENPERPNRSVCEKGRIVHFVTGDDMDCHTCDGKGTIVDPATWVCNACGGPMCPEDAGGGNDLIPHGLVDAHVTGGYASRHIFDMTTYTWSMCEKCLRAMFEGFKIKPLVHDCMSADVHTYEEDSRYYKQRMWEDSGEAVAWANTGKCNQVFECPNPVVAREFCSDSFVSRAGACKEHKTRGCASNVYFVTDPKLAALPFYDYNRESPYVYTREQKLVILGAWFRNMIGEDRRVCYWRGGPPPAREFFGVEYVYDEDAQKWGTPGGDVECVWVPEEQDNPDFVPFDISRALHMQAVASGVLTVWPFGTLKLPLPRAEKTTLGELSFRMPAIEGFGDNQQPFKKREEEDPYSRDTEDT